MTTRADVLTGLQRELRHAEDVGEEKYVRQLKVQIASYSQGNASNPAQETTAARRPARSKR